MAYFSVSTIWIGFKPEKYVYWQTLQQGTTVTVLTDLSYTYDCIYDSYYLQWLWRTVKNESLLCLAHETAVKWVQKEQKGELYGQLSETVGLQVNFSAILSRNWRTENRNLWQIVSWDLYCRF